MCRHNYVSLRNTNFFASKSRNALKNIFNEIYYFIYRLHRNARCRPCANVMNWMLKWFLSHVIEMLRICVSNFCQVKIFFCDIIMAGCRRTTSKKNACIFGAIKKRVNNSIEFEVHSA